MENTPVTRIVGQKKPYIQPSLTEYGAVEDLVLGVNELLVQTSTVHTIIATLQPTLTLGGAQVVSTVI